MDVRTDYVPGIEFSSYVVRVNDYEVTSFADSDAPFNRGVRVAELEEVPRVSTLVELELVASDGSVTATQRARVQVGEATAVTLIVTRSCENIECPQESTALGVCIGGQCEDERCTPQSEEFCQRERGCVSDSDCDRGETGCIAWMCSEFGDCVSQLDHDSCPDNELCNPSEGCHVPSSGPLCDPVPDADTVALYTFDLDSRRGAINDQTGQHPGEFVADGVRWIGGPELCGRALSGEPFFSSSLYAHVPDSRDFDLETGSIDFWLYRAGAAASSSLVSRDASGTELPGHFDLQTEAEGVLRLRVQNTETATSLVPVTRLPDARWVHLGINFGEPIEIWIDGRRQDAFDVEMRTTATSIRGNQNPWTFLSSSSRSQEGRLPPLTTNDRTPSAASGVAIDHLRISRVRRDYSAYAR